MKCGSSSNWLGLGTACHTAVIPTSHPTLVESEILPEADTLLSTSVERVFRIGKFPTMPIQIRRRNFVVKVYITPVDIFVLFTIFVKVKAAIQIFEGILGLALLHSTDGIERLTGGLSPIDGWESTQHAGGLASKEVDGMIGKDDAVIAQVVLHGFQSGMNMRWST